MRNRFQLAITLIIIVITGASCQKTFEDLNINHNKPISVPAALLFNGVLNDITEHPSTMFERWDQYYLCNYDYYGNNRYDFGSGSNYYGTLKNVAKMEEEALKNGAAKVNPYSALAKFFRAYIFTKMSLQMGDLPMNDALRGLDILKPKYDAQKAIFKQAFTWLDSANTELSQLGADNSLTNDIYFNNDIGKWRKTVNTYRIRMLIELSKQSGDAELNIPQQFQMIISNPAKYPVMVSMDDNMQYTYVAPTNFYPMNPSNFGFDALRYNMSNTYVGLLTTLNDPRVFVTAEPASAKLKSGISPNSFDAFKGADPGEDLGSMYAKANAGEYSLINRYHFYQTYTGEPAIQVGYPELMFNIAEAINRGWIASGPLGNAEAYYKEGIKQSLGFYKIPVTGGFTAYFLASGSPGNDAKYNNYAINFEFDNYYQQAAVKYAGNSAAGLTQILNQRYIALFRHSGLEAYFQNRRTGVPVFTTGPGTGNGGRIAKRFQYFQSERTTNTDNYKAALQAQYNGNDDINGIMWIIK